ncbi:unnamed protein product [Caenorhabditis sp. 36 PRJEB53466]|nr:unnamed protein product [Caenorhabditis sp. 36 PRJEB53466]
MADETENIGKSSEAIIADLLNDVKSSEQPFSVDKLAGCDETGVVEKRKKKHHKSRSHKSKKSKRDRKRSRTYSNSSVERSRSRERKRSRKGRDRSRNLIRTWSRSRSPSKKRVEKKKNTPTKPDSQQKESTKPNPKKEEEDVKSIPDSEFKEFRPKREEETLPEGAIFPTDFVKKEAKMEISITTVLPEPEKRIEVEDGEIADIAYAIEARDDRSETENKEEKKKESENGKKENRKKKEKNDEESPKKKKKEKSDKKRKTSTSSAKKESRSIRRRSRSKNLRRSRSPVHRRSSPVPVREKGESRLIRRSISRGRRGRSRERESKRRNAATERRAYDEYRRKRSRSREAIDKEKLLAIAKTKHAEMMSNGDRNNASIEAFVTYCKKLQRKQEREKKREAGQAVSDHESDGETVQYKHPYAIPKEPIRINIVTAASASMAQKAICAAEEPTQLNSSQLRIVFPVSSGAVHKENAEWVPVEKNDVPKSCSVEQKKHVALTSLEIDRCRAQGIPIAPVPIPKFLDSILPPPPAPPKFLPNFSDPYRPPTPPSLPSVLYVPQKDKMIIKEPKEILIPAPSDIGLVLKQRTEAQKKLYSTPNDFEAHRALREANEKIESWAALKSLPGEYTGTTGLKLLTADELQPHNPKYHAWVRRDQFKNAAPATGGIGKLMMERMGWRPGEGLGKDATGAVEPLVLDVKNDRKGLMAEEEMTIKQRHKLNAQNNVPVDLSTKNPISLLMELCAKRRWSAPAFSCEESGADHMKVFVWTVVINNVEYRPMCGSKQKKEGKAVAAQVALQSLGVLPRDPDLAVIMN